MLTQGHSVLLKDALSLIFKRGDEDATFILHLLDFSPSLFRKFSKKKEHKNEMFQYITYEGLKHGLAYPDFPCGKFDVQNGKFKMLDASLCSIYKLAYSIKKKKGFSSDEINFAHLSHKGQYSILHAMTHHPHFTVSEIKTKIINQAIIFAILSVKDTLTNDMINSPRPNIMWLGQLLHMIQDSYSPSHTIRSNTFRSGKSKEIKFIKLLRFLSKDKEYLSYQYDDITTEVANNFIDFVIEKAQKQNITFKNKRDIHKFIKEYAKDNFPFELNKERIDKMTELFIPLYIFKLYPELQSLDSYVSKAAVSIKHIIGDYIHTHPIINFQYYNNQEQLAHSIGDTIHSVKKKNLYTECVFDSSIIILMYASILRKLEQNPENIDDFSLQFAGLVDVHY
jgi:hypothetical protein